MNDLCSVIAWKDILLVLAGFLLSEGASFLKLLRHRIAEFRNSTLLLLHSSEATAYENKVKLLADSWLVAGQFSAHGYLLNHQNELIYLNLNHRIAELEEEGIRQLTLTLQKRQIVQKIPLDWIAMCFGFRLSWNIVNLTNKFIRGKILFRRHRALAFAAIRKHVVAEVNYLRFICLDNSSTRFLAASLG